MSHRYNEIRLWIFVIIAVFSLTYHLDPRKFGVGAYTTWPWKTEKETPWSYVPPSTRSTLFRTSVSVGDSTLGDLKDYIKELFPYGRPSTTTGEPRPSRINDGPWKILPPRCKTINYDLAKLPPDYTVDPNITRNPSPKDRNWVYTRRKRKTTPTTIKGAKKSVFTANPSTKTTKKRVRKKTTKSLD